MDIAGERLKLAEKARYLDALERNGHSSEDGLQRAFVRQQNHEDGGERFRLRARAEELELIDSRGLEQQRLHDHTGFIYDAGIAGVSDGESSSSEDDGDSFYGKRITTIITRTASGPPSPFYKDPIFDGPLTKGLAISRDETSGNNLETGRLDVIAGGTFEQQRTRRPGLNARTRHC